MRFPRHAKIFRGQLDMIPVANVFFLLLIFVLLASLVYTPGVPFRIDSGLGAGVPAARQLLITKAGDIIFEGKTNRIGELDVLRDQFKSLPPQSAVLVKIEPTAPRELILHVREQTTGLPIRLETPLPIELPESGNLSGTPNPTVAVAVNLGGQFFYENKIVRDEELRIRLQSAVRNTKTPLTLLVLADKSAPTEVTVRLARIAREAGIAELLLVGRPRQ